MSKRSIVASIVTSLSRRKEGSFTHNPMVRAFARAVHYKWKAWKR